MPTYIITKRIYTEPEYLSYIYLGSSVCHIPVIFLSSCHIPVCRCCGTLSYSLCFSHQTDQGDKTESFEREGLEKEDRRWRNLRGRVWRDFSLFKPYLINMNVHSATCSCSVELYKLWDTLADFVTNWDISRGFLINFAVYLCTFAQCVFNMRL